MASLCSLKFALVVFIIPLYCSSAEIGKDPILLKLEKLENLFARYEESLAENRKELNELNFKVIAFNRTQGMDTAVVTVDTYTDDNSDTRVKRAAATTPSSSGPVLFSAYLGQTYSIMSPRQTIVFDRVTTSVGNGYDRNFGVFQAPTAGLYEFIATVAAEPNHYVNVEMVRNDQQLCLAHASSPDRSVGACVAMVHLNAGDDVFVRHFSGQGTAISNYEKLTTLTGHFIADD